MTSGWVTRYVKISLHSALTVPNQVSLADVAAFAYLDNWINVISAETLSKFPALAVTKILILSLFYLTLSSRHFAPNSEAWRKSQLTFLLTEGPKLLR